VTPSYPVTRRVTRVTGAITGAFLLALTVAITACTAESTPEDRTSAPVADGGGADADAAVTPLDPTGGRDDNAASCYAACQNTRFTCQTKGDSSAALATVDVAVDERGCSGTIGSVSAPADQGLAIKVDCRDKTVCKGDAPGAPATVCVSGTFSAFSFAYTPSGAAAASVCTRN
jgi:hypothetical protein